MIEKHRKLLARLNNLGRPHGIDCTYTDGRWQFWKDAAIITSTPVTKQAERVLKDIIHHTTRR